MSLSSNQLSRVLELSHLLSDAQVVRVIQALDAGKLSPGDGALAVQDTTGLTGVTASSLAGLLRLWQQAGSTAAELSAALAMVGLAQQQAQKEQPLVSLVWTGPLEAGAPTRSTRLVLEELIRTADQTIVIVGYTITQGAAPVIAHLVEARRQGVQVTIIANRMDQHLSLIRAYWPTNVAPPELYTYPESGEDQMAALHAKALIADRRRMLLTSANMTYHGLTGNIELGVLIEDETAARAVQLIQLLIDRQIVLPIVL